MTFLLLTSTHPQCIRGQVARSEASIANFKKYSSQFGRFFIISPSVKSQIIELYGYILSDNNTFASLDSSPFGVFLEPTVSFLLEKYSQGLSDLPRNRRRSQ